MVERIRRLQQADTQTFRGTRELQFNEAVNFEFEAIFVAVPKTGTTSIRNQLAVPGPQFIPNPHLTIRQIRDGLYAYFLKNGLGNNECFPTLPDTVLSDDEIRIKARDCFDRFFKFASVRNPWARVVSLYHRREGVPMSNHMDFETFCRNLRFASDTCRQPTRAQNQLDWLTDEAGELLVDYVMRLEDRSAGIQEIQERTNGRLKLEDKKLNNNASSTSSAYRENFSKEARAHVAAIFARDIAYFGYEF